MNETFPCKSDLGVRTLTAIAMIVVAGVTLWLGGWFWAVFVALVSMGVLWEWRALVRSFAQSAFIGVLWNLGGFIYVGTAAFMLLLVGREPEGVVLFLSLVIATDVGAYFTGRTVGGPKIASRISPSKTWSGLAGGAVAAALVGMVWAYLDYQQQVADLNEFVRRQGAADAWLIRDWEWGKGLAVGAGAAIVAQAGDFFESWMKRRAGVKDSGKLLPGHGGLFDRLDGLLAVLVVFGIIRLAVMASRT